MQEQDYGKWQLLSPIILESLAMSILLDHQKRMRELKHKLNEVIW